MIAVRYGLPAWFMLVALLVGLVVVIGAKKKLPQDWLNARHAWAFTLFGISVAAATVHLWNSLFVLFMFLIGSGVWMAETNPKKHRQAGPNGKPAQKQRQQRKTLF